MWYWISCSDNLHLRHLTAYNNWLYMLLWVYYPQFVAVVGYQRMTDSLATTRWGIAQAQLRHRTKVRVYQHVYAVSSPCPRFSSSATLRPLSTTLAIVSHRPIHCRSELVKSRADTGTVVEGTAFIYWIFVNAVSIHSYYMQLFTVTLPFPVRD